MQEKTLLEQLMELEGLKPEHESKPPEESLNHLAVAQHAKTLLWHGLYYENHPTPSGCVRLLLRCSTTEGYKTDVEAARAIEKAFPNLDKIDI